MLDLNLFDLIISLVVWKKKGGYWQAVDLEGV